MYFSSLFRMISFRCKEFFTFLYFHFNMFSHLNRKKREKESWRKILPRQFLSCHSFLRSNFFFLSFRCEKRISIEAARGRFFCCGSRLATYFYLILFNGAYTNWMNLSVWFMKGTRQKEERERSKWKKKSTEWKKSPLICSQHFHRLWIDLVEEKKIESKYS